MTATVYADSARTVLANLLTYPGGAAIAGSVVTIDADSLWPVFQGPDNSDTLYYRAVADGVTKDGVLYARADPSDIAADITAEAAARAAADTAEATARATADTALGTRVTALEPAGTIIREGDARLTDARTPTGGAGGVLSGAFPNPGFAVDMANQAELDSEAQARAAADLLRVLLDDPRLVSPTPTPGTLTVEVIGTLATTRAVPLTVTRDGRMFGGYTTLLYEASDEVPTWGAAIHDFAGYNTLIAARLLDDGEMIVSTNYDAVSLKSALHRSSGFAANPATATWTKVLDSSTANTQLHDRTLSVWKNYVFVGEYGAQGQAQKAWLSTDYGATFTVVFDCATQAGIGNVPLAHVHGLVIDPYDRHLWLATGDTDANKGIWFASLDAPTVWTKLYAEQPTTLAVVKNGLLMGGDNAPYGVLRARRYNPLTGAYLAPAARTVENVAYELPEGVLGSRIFHRGRAGDPVLISMGPLNAGDQGYLVATVDGEDFFTLYAHPATSAVQRTIGPTDGGYLHGTLTEGATEKTFRAVAPTWDPPPAIPSSDLGARYGVATLARDQLVHPRQQRYAPMWFAASDMEAVLNAPTKTLVNRWPLWSMTDTTSTAVGAARRIPEGWRSYDVTVFVVNLGAGAGAYDLRFDQRELAVGGALSAGTTGAFVTTTAAAQNVVQAVTLATGIPTDPTMTAVFDVQRAPANAADTLANAIGVVGVLLTKAS